MTAEEALADAMSGLEDGYSRHFHRDIVRDTMNKLSAAGFVVVSREPTEAMVRAGVDSMNLHRPWRHDIAACYRAMLAAVTSCHRRRGEMTMEKSKCP